MNKAYSYGALVALTALTGCHTNNQYQNSQNTQNPSSIVYANPNIQKPTLTIKEDTRKTDLQGRSGALELTLEKGVYTLKADYFERDGNINYVLINETDDENRTPFAILPQTNLNFTINSNGQAILSPKTIVYVGQKIDGINSITYANHGSEGLGVTANANKFALTTQNPSGSMNYGVGDKTEIKPAHPLKMINFGGLNYAFPKPLIISGVPESETGYWSQRVDREGFEYVGTNGLCKKIIGPIYSFSKTNWCYLNQEKPKPQKDTNAVPVVDTVLKVE